ncbi:MAG: TetR/AcrR family transcriptional regulator [Bacteriovoracaceae bacterium]|nr:TetR/AcrR family transcriptional regulator [Bacteriovoracaceae bacterium]
MTVKHGRAILLNMSIETTKDKIIKTAFEFTSKFGLESLTIGELAKAVGMSKSGLFGHFKSKEKLQMMVLDFSAENFTHKVIKPALLRPRGIPRLEGMVEGWVKWSTSTHSGGCPIVAAAIEFDDRPGNIRDRIQELLQLMMATYAKAAQIAVDEGQLKADLDTEQFAYELYSLMMGHHVYNRLLADKNAKNRLNVAFEGLVGRYKV